MERTELSEARFQFALKCLQTVVHIKKSENVVFSPYSIYDGLILLYLASVRCNGDIEKHLKRILQLPVNVVKNVIKGFWIIYRADDRKKKLNFLICLLCLSADLLSEAHFQFAVKCLQTVMQIKTSENVVFSPYSIYDGLFLTYLAFENDHDIEKKLKHILQLPVNVPKIMTECFWKIYHINNRRRKYKERDNGYYDINSCWINSSTELHGHVFDRYEKFNDLPYLINRINEVLRDEMQDYFSQPVKLNRLDENMEFVLLSVLRFESKFLSDFHVPNKHHSLEKPKETVLSPKLGMFVTELRMISNIVSLFLLFPAVQSYIPNCWEVDQNISGLVERLTKEGADKLRKVLDKEETSTEKLSTGSVICPDFFELENDLPFQKLVETLSIQLELDTASSSNFSHENPLNLSHESPFLGDMHLAYFKVTSGNVTAGAANIIFAENKGSLESIEKTNYSECKNSFVSLIYERVSRTILFIGIINKNIELAEVSKREAQRYFVEQK